MRLSSDSVVWLVGSLSTSKGRCETCVSLSPVAPGSLGDRLYMHWLQSATRSLSSAAIPPRLHGCLLEMGSHPHALSAGTLVPMKGGASSSLGRAPSSTWRAQALPIGAGHPRIGRASSRV